MKIFVKKIRYRFRPLHRNNTLHFHKQKSYNFVKISILITVIFTTLTIITYKNIEPLLSEKALSKMQAMVTIISNETVLELLNENSTYSNITITEKNENGEIISVKTDIITANKLKSEIVLKLQERVNNLDNLTVFLPLGTIFGSNILSAYGFDIPIKVLGVNNLSANLVNDFTSSGINQTRHSISLNININVSILAALNKQKVDILTQIPISDTIIVGETPKFYSDKN